MLKATVDCQKRFGTGMADGRVLFLFGPKGLAEKATAVSQTFDAGQQVTPGRQPPSPDPGGMPAQPVVDTDGGLVR